MCIIFSRDSVILSDLFTKLATTSSQQGKRKQTDARVPLKKGGWTQQRANTTSWVVLTHDTKGMQRRFVTLIKGLGTTSLFHSVGKIYETRSSSVLAFPKACVPGDWERRECPLQSTAAFDC